MSRALVFAKFFTHIFFWMFVLFFQDNVVHAATYYVDNVLGLDVNDGLSTGAAWSTLSKATTVASAGDTVNVIYNGPTNPFHERLSPARSGTSGSHIRFVGYGGSPYILGTIDYSHSLTTGWLWRESAISGEYYLTKNNGNPSITQARVFATSTNSSWNSSGVEALSNRSTGTIGSLTAGQWNWGDNDSLGYSTIYYKPASGESDITALHIEGGEDGAQHRNPILISWQYIDVENFKVRFSNHTGVLNQTLANYNTFNNIDSSYTGRSGISNATYSNMTVTNSRFDHNGMISTVRADYVGISLSGTTNSTITNNIISNGNNDSGINIKASSNGNYIANNIIFGNAQHGIDVSTTSINNTIYNNTIYNNAEQGINIETSSSGNVVKNNILANNQVYQLSVFDSGSTTGLVLNNNLYYFASPSTSTFRFVGNFYSLNNFSTYQAATGQDANSTASDPIFSNGSGNFSSSTDFKLLPSSPAINAGTSVGQISDFFGTPIPQGIATDIGAVEFSVPNSPASLTQYKQDGITEITPGGTTNETSVVIKISMSSTNSADMLTPQIEIQEQGVAFTNIFTNQGSSVVYSGSPVQGQVPISGLESGKHYHWQVKTSNPAGSGLWTSSGNSRDFSVNISTSTDENNQNVSNTSNASTSTPTTCNDSQPVSSPDIFQVDTQSKTAKVYFTPISNTTKYFLSYSTKPSSEEHGVVVELGSTGVQSYTINLLQPSTNYFIKVRGQNGCMPGQWSKTLPFKTASKYQGHVSSFYKEPVFPQPLLYPQKKKSYSPSLSPVLIPELKIEPLQEIKTSVSPSIYTEVTKNPTKGKRCYFWKWLCF